MCKITHQNFYHNCGHTQTIVKPSINPDCTPNAEIDEVTDEETFYYIQDGDEHNNAAGGWCDRCFYGSWRMDMEYGYTIIGPACRHLELSPDAAPLMCQAQVSLGPLPLVKYGIDELWARRREAAMLWSDYETRQVRADFDRTAALEWRAGLAPTEKTYFLGARSIKSAPDEDLYAPCDVEDILRSQSMCAICRGFIEWGAEDSDDDREDDPDQDPCEGGDAVALPCGHIFGVHCIRGWIEGKAEDEGKAWEERKAPSAKCPSCNFETRIIREPILYPAGFEAAHARFVERRTYLLEHPLRWYEEPFRHWQLRVAVFALTVLVLGFVFESPPWTSWWTIFVLLAGTYWYYIALTVPVVNLTEFGLGFAIWLSFTGRFLEREFWFQWSSNWLAMLVVLAGTFYLGKWAGDSGWFEAAWTACWLVLGRITDFCLSLV